MMPIPALEKFIDIELHISNEEKTLADPSSDTASALPPYGSKRFLINIVLVKKNILL